MKRKLNLLALSALLAGQSWAGVNFFDFNTDPALSSLLTITGAGAWISTDGAGASTNASDGYLKLSGARSESTKIIFADFDAGSVVQSFTFECDLRIGNGSQNPADGFSVNYCRASDPVLTGGEFAQGQNCEANLPEEGTQTGIAIGFDAWDSGGTVGSLCGVVDQSIGPDVAAVTVRVDGILVLQQACPTRNPAVPGTDPTSIQTGPYDGTGGTANLSWQHVKVQLAADGKLSVWWKGAQILNNYQTAYFPSPGRLVFAGRCGDSWQNQHVDNIAISTVAASIAQLGSATGLPDGFSATITDSGSSVVNPATITATLNGSAAAPVTTSKVGATTTITYHGFPTLLTIGATNTVVLTIKDTNGNNVGGTRTFVTPSYKTIPAADAVAGVDTTKVGFRVLPWQSDGQPNQLYWLEEQLLGLHGANNADLTLATDGGYIDFTGVINFNADAGSQQGAFQSGAGYPDSLFPGLPGGNGLTGSTAIEALMYLKFPAGGVYTLVVNSDDGFKVTEGKNPKDRFANQLGSYNGGKGASDVSFTVAVMAAGIYPVRLIWENGNGELPGNGSNLEFFSIANGVRTLINDPDPTNTTGIVAYYAGPALPAYVSHLYPYDGAGGARADKLVAQITAGSTTVSGTPKLYVDGVQLAASVSPGATTTVEAIFTPPNYMAAGKRTAALAWSDSGGTAHSNIWSFTVGRWVTLNAGYSAPLATADTTKPGFTVQVAQLDPDLARPGAGDGMANQVDSANALLGGLYFPWYVTNTVNLTGFPAPLHDNVWAWENPIDFSLVGSLGDFTWNQTMPGIPGVTSKSLNLAAWFKGYVPFTNAGFYRMQISSDDGFRLSQGKGITRQVLHLKGSGVDRDVAAVVTSTNKGDTFGGSLPVVPISGPVAYFPKLSPLVGTAQNLTGKIAAVNNYDWPDRAYVDWAYTNGAIAVILINDTDYGLPYVLGGSSKTNLIHVPVVCVNGFGGEEQMYATNANLVATIGADAQLQIAADDRGRGMGWTSCDFVVPQPGLYPLHLVFEQGGGDGGLEWATAYQDSLAWDVVRRLLVQDTFTAGSTTAYRDLTVQPTPTVSVVNQGGVWKVVFTGLLTSSATVNGTYVPVPGATSPYTIPTGSAPAQFYRAVF